MVLHHCARHWNKHSTCTKTFKLHNNPMIYVLLLSQFYRWGTEAVKIQFKIGYKVVEDRNLSSLNPEPYKYYTILLLLQVNIYKSPVKTAWAGTGRIYVEVTIAVIWEEMNGNVERIRWRGINWNFKFLQCLMDELASTEKSKIIEIKFPHHPLLYLNLSASFFFILFSASGPRRSLCPSFPRVTLHLGSLGPTLSTFSSLIFSPFLVTPFCLPT